jgi:hypothetical protein
LVPLLGMGTSMGLRGKKSKVKRGRHSPKAQRNAMPSERRQPLRSKLREWVAKELVGTPFIILRTVLVLFVIGWLGLGAPPFKSTGDNSTKSSMSLQDSAEVGPLTNDPEGLNTQPGQFSDQPPTSDGQQGEVVVSAPLHGSVSLNDEDLTIRVTAIDYTGQPLRRTVSAELSSPRSAVIRRIEEQEPGYEVTFPDSGGGCVPIHVEIG